MRLELTTLCLGSRCSTTELRPLVCLCQCAEMPPSCDSGGAEGIRTPDLLNAIQALSQLSYSPSAKAPHHTGRPRSLVGPLAEGDQRDSNPRPPDPQSGALPIELWSPGNQLDAVVWAILDSNQGPLPYQRSALTS
jgi:hypothetical protein